MAVSHSWFVEFEFGYWYLQNFVLSRFISLVDDCETIYFTQKAMFLSILELSFLTVSVSLPLVSSVILMMDVEHDHDRKDVNNYVRNTLHSIKNADSLVLEEEVLPEEVEQI